MRLLLVLALALAVLGLGAAQKISLLQFEAEVFRLTNVERVRHGLQPLLPDDGLVDLARVHANNMATQGFFEHKDKQGLEVSGRQKKYYASLLNCSIGENLYYIKDKTLRFSPAEVVTGWMNSPGHRKNMLQPDFTHLGVASALYGDEFYVVQNFARPILRMLSVLPQHFSVDTIYRMEFEYMSPRDSAGLQASLFLPNKNERVFISKDTFLKGVQPLEISWQSDKRFGVDIPLSHGKGIYKLVFGWGNSFFESNYIFKAK